MKPFSLLSVAFSLLSSACFAQETPLLSRTVVKMSPQHFTQNALKGGVERFNRNHSASVSLMITGRLANSDENMADRNEYDGLAGELQLRKYISPMRSRLSKRGNSYHQGIYGAAYVQGGSYSGKFKQQYRQYDPSSGSYTYQTIYDYSENIGNWGGGFIMGYQKTLWQVVFLEVFVGGGIQFSDPLSMGLEPENIYHDRSAITDPAYKGILPKMGVNIGIGL